MSNFIKRKKEYFIFFTLKEYLFFNRYEKNGGMIGVKINNPQQRTLLLAKEILMQQKSGWNVEMHVIIPDLVTWFTKLEKSFEGQILENRREQVYLLHQYYPQQWFIEKFSMDYRTYKKWLKGFYPEYFDVALTDFERDCLFAVAKVYFASLQKIATLNNLMSFVENLEKDLE